MSEPTPPQGSQPETPAPDDLPGQLQEVADRVSGSSASGRRYRLEDPRFVRRLIWLGVLILATLLFLDPLIGEHKAHFAGDEITVDTYPEFFPTYGFLACLIMVLVAKGLGLLLKRKDTYYDAG